jgi:molybdopterin-guanine dinucleotide biosynthesis protein A
VTLARFDGLLLAGGRSRRFGSDKRLALVGDEPMVARAARTLRMAANGTIFVATGERRELLPGTAQGTILRDEPPGSGPLGGIAAALARTSTGVLVLACDLPFVKASLLRTVALAGLRLRRPSAARTARGWEPLVAYYPREALNDVRAAISQGRLALHELLDRLRAVPVAAGGEQLRNVNRREDLDPS